MSANKARILINSLAFASLGLSLLIQNNVFSLLLALICVVFALVILYRNLAQLSNVSESSPKLKLVRWITIFNVLFIAAIVVFVIMLEKQILTITDRQSQYLLAGILAVLMIGFGNVAPKLPFNRYTGLRLPWTVSDEDTWIVAHRILGYISLPLGILCMLGATVQMPLESYARIWFFGPLMLWIGIPGILSGVFYYKKWNGKL